jgi:hypothetical protein
MGSKFKTLREVEITKGAYCAIPNIKVLIPKGSPVDLINDTYFVNPVMFGSQSIDFHDAVHYGFRIDKDNIEAN